MPDFEERDVTCHRCGVAFRKRVPVGAFYEVVCDRCNPKTCDARIATLEAELEAAAKILQAALPIGQVKAIGLLEVAEGVRLLAECNAAMEAVLRECREIVQERHDAGAFLCEQFPSYRQEQENIAEAERMTQLLSRIDQLTAKVN